MNFSTPRPRSD